MPTVGDWLDVLDRLYPPSWAEPWDNVGLQVGGRDWPADRLLVALDPTREIVDEARARTCGLVVAHHPLILRPLERLDADDPTGGAAIAAASGGVAVAAAHTNADVASPGVSDALAEALDVGVTGVLRPTTAGERVKLVAFVPADATAKVLDAVATAGAGVIGEYAHCSFRVRGTGTFVPSHRANPVLGQRGELTEVEEDRLEVVLPRERLDAVVAALIDAHPYEEVAYDVYPLVGGGGAGLGRIGRIGEPVPAHELARRWADRLGVRVRLAGDPERSVSTVALCGGSGGSLVGDAIAAGVDAYVTGDLKHHQALDAIAAGLVAIDAGHHGTEWPFVRRLAERLRDAAGDLGGEVLVAETGTDPFRVR